MTISVKDAAGATQTVKTVDDIAVGAGTATGAQRIVTASDSPEIPLVGGLTETAPASDTASSGLNGRLQRIAQRLTSMIAQLPASLGQKASAASLAVVLPSDGATLPATLGQKAMSASLAVALASDQSGLPLAALSTDAPTATFTRPADTTAYAVGDLVGNSVTAASVTRMNFTAARVAAGSGSIRRARLKKSGTGVTNAQFRLHLFKVDPGVLTVGDNAAITFPTANWIGSIDITVDQVGTDGAKGVGAPNAGSEINFKLASGTTVFGVLEARGAYTPASAEVFIVDLEVMQD